MPLPLDQQCTIFRRHGARVAKIRQEAEPFFGFDFRVGTCLLTGLAYDRHIHLTRINTVPPRQQGLGTQAVTLLFRAALAADVPRVTVLADDKGRYAHARWGAVPTKTDQRMVRRGMRENLADWAKRDPALPAVLDEVAALLQGGAAPLNVIAHVKDSPLDRPAEAARQMLLGGKVGAYDAAWDAPAMEAQLARAGVRGGRRLARLDCLS